jgi:exosome complex component RRP42
MPKVKVEEEKVVTLEETEPFPLQGIPMACSIAKFGPNLIVDPTNEEEIAMDSKIVFGIDEEGNIRALQKSGSGPWTRDEIQAGLDLASKTIKALRKKLKLEKIT